VSKIRIHEPSDGGVIVGELPRTLETREQAIVRRGERAVPHELRVEEVDRAGMRLRIDATREERRAQHVEYGVVRARDGVGVEPETDERLRSAHGFARPCELVGDVALAIVVRHSGIASRAREPKRASSRRRSLKRARS
jgi:hypothetical protein